MALLRRSSKKVTTTGKGAGAGARGSKPPTGKAGKVGKDGKPKRSRKERLSQIRQAFTATRKNDPKLLPLLLAAFFGTLLLMIAIGFVLGYPVYLGVLGLMVALTVTALVFGRRVQATAFTQVEGQLGAAAAVLNSMRGDWRVTPAVGFTREQDLLHRVIGTPGIVLVAEGSPARTRGLLATEKRRLTRLVGQTPVYDVVVGDDADSGQVPLRRLEKHFVKLPKNIKGKQVNELDRRLKAIAAPPMPVPKGPMPRGGKVPRR